MFRPFAAQLVTSLMWWWRRRRRNDWILVYMLAYVHCTYVACTGMYAGRHRCTPGTGMAIKTPLWTILTLDFKRTKRPLVFMTLSTTLNETKAWFVGVRLVQLNPNALLSWQVRKMLFQMLNLSGNCVELTHLSFILNSAPLSSSRSVEEEPFSKSPSAASTDNLAKLPIWGPSPSLGRKRRVEWKKGPFTLYRTFCTKLGFNHNCDSGLCQQKNLKGASF